MSGKIKGTMLIASVVFLLLSITSCGLFETSGGELYDACSIALHIPDSKKTSEQKINSARGIEFAKRVFFENGYVYVGNEKDPKIQNLKNYCPDIWTSPMGGPYVFLVKYWDKNGISFLEKHVYSADYAAGEVFKKMFPQCPQERAKAGVPKVTKY